MNDIEDGMGFSGLVLTKEERYVEKLEKENKKLRKNQKYSCPAVKGSQPINEACGGCDGCIEMQMHHTMDEQLKEIKNLKAENDKLRECVEYVANCHPKLDHKIKYANKTLAEVDKG